jgi:hypothetical protein
LWRSAQKTAISRRCGKTDLAKITKAAEAALKARDEAIRQAHKNGASLRQIAKATGLSHQRIHQIVQASVLALALILAALAFASPSTAATAAFSAKPCEPASSVECRFIKAWNEGRIHKHRHHPPILSRLPEGT